MSGKVDLKAHDCQINEYDSAKIFDVLAQDQKLNHFSAPKLDRVKAFVPIMEGNIKYGINPFANLSLFSEKLEPVLSSGRFLVGKVKNRYETIFSQVGYKFFTSIFYTYS